jgi:hypothetical protein
MSKIGTCLTVGRNFTNERASIITTLGAISADRDNATVPLFRRDGEAEVPDPQPNIKNNPPPKRIVFY